MWETSGITEGVKYGMAQYTISLQRLLVVNKYLSSYLHVYMHQSHRYIGAYRHVSNKG